MLLYDYRKRGGVKEGTVKAEKGGGSGKDM